MDGQQDLEQLILEASSVRDHLDDFALRISHHVGTDTHCSISLRHGGRDRLAASSSPRAMACDEAEYASGAGPCVSAMDRLQVIVVPHIAEETRWEAWRREAEVQGFRSAAAVPATVVEGVDIALNLYSDSVDPWDAATLVRADVYAQHIAQTVGLCLQVAELSHQVTDLRAALRARDAIDSAVRSVMDEHGSTAVEALEILRSTSTVHGIPTQEAAALLRRAPEPTPPLSERADQD